MEIIVGVIGLVFGIGIAFFINNNLNNNKANLIIEDAKKEAEQIRKEKLLQAKEKFLELKAEHEKEISKKNNGNKSRSNRFGIWYWNCFFYQ